MKLAETLTQIKDIKGKLSALQTQLLSKLTVVMVTKEQAVPDNDAVIREIQELSDKLATLKSRVAATNVKHGLMQKLYQYQEAKFMVSVLEPLTKVEQKDFKLQGGGFGQAQEKFEVLATFDVNKAKELLAAAQERLRSIDLELQRQNWVIDLVQ